MCKFTKPSPLITQFTGRNTVCFRLVSTPISEESKSLYLRNYSKYYNMQFIIEKPYRMVTKNAKKNFNFSTFVRFLGPFLKKQRFWKMDNFETDENFWVKLSVNLLHQVSWQINTKWLGVLTVWYLPHPFQKHNFFKNGPQNLTKVESLPKKLY